MQESKSETRWISVFLLWGIGLAAAMQFAKLSISLSDLSNHYSVKESWIALLLSSVGFTGIVLGAAAGAIVGAVGPRKALLTALIVGIIASALQSLMPAFGLMLGSRVFEGLWTCHVFVPPHVLV